MLNQKIRARIRIKFRKKSHLVDMITLFDPSKKFEETKFANFRSSSKLEGIEIHNSVPHTPAVNGTNSSKNRQ